MELGKNRRRQSTWKIKLDCGHEKLVTHKPKDDGYGICNECPAQHVNPSRTKPSDDLRDAKEAQQALRELNRNVVRQWQERQEANRIEKRRALEE